MKFLLLFSLLLPMASCNAESEPEKIMADYGTIVNIDSESQYFINTDKYGTIFSYDTNIKLKNEDKGKRVLVNFTTLTTPAGLAFKWVKINNIGIIPYETAVLLSEIEGGEAGVDLLKTTAQEYVTIAYLNGIMNFEFDTTSNSYFLNGKTALIYDDINSTEDIKKFIWTYIAEGSDFNWIRAFASFKVANVIDNGSSPKVEIRYKSIKNNNQEAVVEFQINHETPNKTSFIAQ